MVDFYKPRFYYADLFNEYEHIFDDIGHVKTIRAGSIIKHPGDMFDPCHYIKSGFCKFAVSHENGALKTIAFFGPHSLFAMYSPPRKYRTEINGTQVAMTDMKVIAVPQEKIRKMMQEDSKFHFLMTDVYVELFAQMIYEAVNAKNNDSLTKLCDFLILYCLAMNTDYVPLSQENIGDALGLCRTNVARQLRNLREEGAISSYNKKIKIEKSELVIKHCSSEVKS